MIPAFSFRRTLLLFAVLVATTHPLPAPVTVLPDPKATPVPRTKEEATPKPKPKATPSRSQTKNAPVVRNPARPGASRYATRVTGKPGYVISPFAPNSGYIDVRGFPRGTEVRDPYTGGIFLVP
jgi:hypothetical protein